MFRLHLSALALPCVALIAGSALAETNSLNDYLGPREISVGEAMRGNAQGASSIALNPAGLAMNRQIVFEGYGGFRNDDGAVPLNVAACDSTVPVAGCFYYRYFTATPMSAGVEFDKRVHEAGTSAARALGRSVLIGINARYFNTSSELAEEEDGSGFAFDGGLMFAPSPYLGVGLAAYNLVVTQENSQYPRAIGAGISVRPGRALSISFDGLWNFDKQEEESTGRYGLGAEFALQTSNKQSAYPLRIGGIHDVGLDASFVTAGIGFISRRMGLDLGYRQKLGDASERLFMAGIRLFGPTLH